MSNIYVLIFFVKYYCINVVPKVHKPNPTYLTKCIWMTHPNGGKGQNFHKERNLLIHGMSIANEVGRENFGGFHEKEKWR